MIIGKNIRIKWNKNNKKRFEEKGYKFTNYGDEFLIKLEDLNSGSTYKVDCKCDFCGKEFFGAYYALLDSEKHTCGNQECKKKLRKETFMKRYGVDNPSKIDAVKAKTSSKFMANYGIGSPNHDDYVNRRNATNMKNCGNKKGYVDTSETQSKRIKTMFKNFDEADCKKDRRKTVSTQQIEICKILDGVLNKQIGDGISAFCIDVALEDEKIAIEYNGVGHHMYLNERDDKVRDLQLYELCWRTIRISTNGNHSAPKDKLISIVDFSKKMFDKSNCYSIVFDLDNETLMIDYEKKVEWKDREALF